MQIQRMPQCFFTLANYVDRYKAREKHLDKYLPKVEAWEKLMKYGIEQKLLKEFVEISRSTYYRYKRHIKNIRKGILPVSTKSKQLRVSSLSKEVKGLVLKIRRENPSYGKSKITTILKRDYGITYSESTIGRILKEYMKKGIIIKSLSAPRQKRNRRFTKYAQKWQYKMKSKKPGEMVQIDHMTATKNNITVKHFQAWDPKSKVMVVEVYSNATSNTAKKFLQKVISTVPFELKSIQVDGGSEFMKEFEEECALHKIPLFVLPPNRPQYNGGVERGNRIFKEEFYYNRLIPGHSLGEIRNELHTAAHKYNSYRPHFNLQNLTPYEYINKYMVA